MDFSEDDARVGIPAQITSWIFQVFYAVAFASESDRRSQPGFLTRNWSKTMKLPDFPRKTTEVVTGVVSALRRRWPTEFPTVKIGQIRRYSRLRVGNPG
jgi:hypothetical protein